MVTFFLAEKMSQVLAHVAVALDDEPFF